MLSIACDKTWRPILVGFQLRAEKIQTREFLGSAKAVCLYVDSQRGKLHLDYKYCPNLFTAE